MAEGTYTHDAVYRIFRCIYQTVCLDDPSVCQHVVRTHGHVSAYLPDIYINGSLTVASVLFNIFMNLLEVLVAFIQAYVFTMLSAVFIGLAQEGGKKEEVKE